MLDYLGQNRALKAEVVKVLRAGLSREETLARLAELLPPEIFAKVAEVRESPEELER